MLVCESCGRRYMKSFYHKSSRFCHLCSLGRCRKCEASLPVKKQHCKFMGHDEICPNCGYCKDCEKYHEELKLYEALTRNADYFFEPWDEWDTPENRIPKKPVERYKTFPSGRHKIEQIKGPVIEGNKLTFINLTVVIKAEVSSPLGSGGHNIVGIDSFEIPFSWLFDPDSKAIRPTVIDPYSNKYWQHLEKCFTKQALDKFMEVDLYQNHVLPFIKEGHVNAACGEGGNHS